MPVLEGTATFTADELDGVYVLLAEAISDLAADSPCEASDCIQRAMRRLGHASLSVTTRYWLDVAKRST